MQRGQADRELRAVYAALFTAFGPRHWWPGDSPFEVMVGAVLTQNTAWVNVERAIANLKQATALEPEAIRAMGVERLARLLRPSGYFNIKARRLKNLCRWYLDNGGLTALGQWDTRTLRVALLGVNGIGPETADDILLYAFERPVFVIDAYTRRLFSRLGLITGDEGYETLRAWFEAHLEPAAPLYNEYHALIVIQAKAVCRKRPLCEHCCVAGRCGYRRRG